MSAESPLRRARFYKTILLLCLACFLLASCKKPGATQSSSSGPRLKWQYKSSAYGLSHPAIGSDGTIYVGTNNRGLQAISSDGKFLWRSTIGAAGVPVAADDGNIYFAMPQGLIYGIDHDGKVVWQPGYGLIGFATPPALSSGEVLYYLNITSDVWAFRTNNTKDLWSLETFREGFLKPDVLPGEARTSTHGGGAPAVGHDGTLYVARQNFLHGISSRGELQWTTELSPGTLGPIALDGNDTVYVGDDRGVLYAVDSSGTRKWRFDSGLIGAPVIDTEGTLYFSDGGAMFALNPDSSIKWRYAQPKPPGSRFFTPPVLAADGTLYVGSEFALIAIKADGTLKWTLRVPTPTSAPTIAPDGTILFACGYGELCAVEDAGSPLMQSAWPKQFHDLANTSSALTHTN